MTTIFITTIFGYISSFGKLDRGVNSRNRAF